MHRDQIRIFPGDVDSQVRRLGRFCAPSKSMMLSAREDEIAEALSTYLDYATPQMSRWERWLREVWQQGPFIVLLILLLLCGR